MTESVLLAVSGMKCGGCESNVKNKLGEIEGISSVEASSQENTVKVEFESEKVNIETISQAITDAGFVVE